MLPCFLCLLINGNQQWYSSSKKCNRKDCEYFSVKDEKLFHLYTIHSAFEF